MNPERVHTTMVSIGENLGSKKPIQQIVAVSLTKKQPILEQKILGISFTTPMGLAAGFDYEARLTQSLFPWGFGFQTVGTITNNPYEGNPRPMLGRLPKSKSLMVNKGFKNLGAETTAKKLKGLTFKIPVGISIGRTNSPKLTTQEESIKDILIAFRKFEKEKIKNAYYELNISCPNLYGDITFYPPKNLDQLLTAIDKLHLKKPVFIKMPIEKSDKEVLSMLSIIAKHSPQGVIFGNLQKDRKNPVLVKEEVSKFPKGNFSGKPTYKRSNELIKVTYKKYRKRFVIIGCGGVFCAQDAYEKITLGASLVQIITGMIFEGPQVIAAINMELPELLKKDGFTHIQEAIGSRNSKK
jgi:dihydroorotate dehydrogenase subfamily 2